MVLASLFFIIGGASMGGGMRSEVPLALMGVIYLIVAALYFFPTYYLFNFARKTKKGLKSSIQSEFDEGLKNLKSMYKFVGIFTVVILSIYVLLLLIGLFAGVSGGF